MADGAEHGLYLLDQLQHDPALANYPPLAASRGTFLRRLERHEEADAAFQDAARHTDNTASQQLYQRQRHHPEDTEA